MTRRLFTPIQANRTLPLVKRIVADILTTGRDLRELIAERGAQADHERISELQDELHRVMRELHDVGCEYKDWNFEIGLVDFPSRIDGEAVLLCWRSDEPSVKWYHAVDAGYAGRKLIPQHLLEDDPVAAGKPGS